ncbi:MULTISPECIES: hypothetical protein [unclassified Streptomyces]|uniref:hypothetical protein n=1 Tax=unclassified Streptomyces TaxID=2593676 RepID=UPI00225BBC02|nr:MULTISPECIES: hypothetical protein [unclassified Streptomyces]MCX5336093.1 hypothetical protein [Streptomyces sp. NBC_00140]MCX5366814.1 hypothetical protein [Streptomyces sp. NBC_00124]
MGRLSRGLKAIDTAVEGAAEERELPDAQGWFTVVRRHLIIPTVQAAGDPR